MTMQKGNFDKYLARFEEYVAPYLEEKENASSMRIKKEHTLNVVKQGSKIMLELPEELHFASLLSCLFHDIGRFEQMRIYKTFHDPKSCNHAMLGLKVLKKEKILDDVDKETKQLVYTAIALHNRYIFPMQIAEKYKPISLLLRDADKIDIMRVMVENFVEAKGDSDTLLLHVKDEPKYTLEILNSLLTKQAIRYSDLVYVNDFRLLLGGWISDLNYQSSKNILKESGYIDFILKDLPDDENIKKAREFIYSLF